MRGGAGPCPPPSPSPPPGLRRAEPSLQPFPWPSPGIPTLATYGLPVHTFSQLPFLMIPQPFMALSASPSTSVSLPFHPPGQPATSPVVSTYKDLGRGKRGEGHIALAKAPAHPLSQTYTPHWRSLIVPTARHTFLPVKTELSAQVSGSQPSCLQPAPTPYWVIVVSVWIVFLLCLAPSSSCSPSSPENRATLGIL